MASCCSKTPHRNASLLEEAQKRTWVLRVAFVLSLAVAAAICGWISYVVIDDLEQDVGTQTYESVATSALENAQAITKRKLKGGDAMASLLAHAFPNSSQWPMISLNGYADTAGELAQLSSSITLAVDMLVTPDQVDEFEAHAKRVYQKEGYPDTAGYSDFGFGIWKQDSSENPQYEDGRLPDKTADTTWNSSYEILAPIFLHNNVNAASLLLNVHEDYFRGQAIDSMLDCVNEATVALREADQEDNKEQPACTVVTDFIELVVRPGPAALIYGPIYPANDPTTIVAMTGTTIHWEEVLTNVVPDYVDGLDCVVSTDTRSVTYVIRDGVPELKGEGDLHDLGFDHMSHSTVLNDEPTGALQSKAYRLTIYPTNEMLGEFRTNSPMAIAMGFVGVILFCAALFFSYDFFMRGESRQNKIILEMKRRFVRFVSHEIRTPLNTVCMGLELLRAELGSQLTDSSSGAPTGSASSTTQHDDEEMQALTASSSNFAATKNSSQASSNKQQSPSSISHQSSIRYLLDLTGDILDNSESAVAILNDLLNYDKIETGTFQLEVGVVPIWELTRRTVAAFDIQARKRNVKLQYEVVEHTDEGPDSREEKRSNHLFVRHRQNHHHHHSIHNIDKKIATSEQSPKVADNNKEADAEAGLGLENLNVVGDDMRLRQVILNLVSNSLKFVDENKGEIIVTTSYLPKGLPGYRPLYTSKDGGKQHCETIEHERAGAIRISVKDNGEGMSEEQQGRLFREGVQFDANKLQAGGGSGLGLYITKGLVEQHGGTIEVESPGIGFGSTFTIELPLYQCQVPSMESMQTQTPDTTTEGSSKDAAAAAGSDSSKVNTKSLASTATTSAATPNDVAATPAVAKPQAPPAHRHILVVDDAAMNRKMLMRLLEWAGHTCQCAVNGREAIDAVLQDQERATQDKDYQTFDTILMDYEMPILNGPDATQELRELGCTAFVVGVTGNVLAEDINYFKSKGADTVLAKPLNVAALDEVWKKFNR